MTYKSKYIDEKWKVLKNGKIVSNSELLEYLIKFYNESGKVPTLLDFNRNSRYPSFYIYQKVFGGWNSAIELAGFKPKKGDAINYTEEELLEYIRQFYRANNRIPKAKNFVNTKYPHFSTYQRIFGSWNSAIELAGFKPKKGDAINYTEEQLLEYLKKFYNENGRYPVCTDFKDNHNYPSCNTYYKWFGSWNKALKMVGLDVDSMIGNGVIENEYQKGRSFELKVKEYLGEEVKDLSGENSNSPYDGIFQTGTYDAKGGKLQEEKYWHINFENVDKEEIHAYYIGLFDKKFDKLLYVLKIPAWDFMEIIEKGYMQIGIDDRYKYNLENMKEYDITDKFKED